MAKFPSTWLWWSWGTCVTCVGSDRRLSVVFFYGMMEGHMERRFRPRLVQRGGSTWHVWLAMWYGPRVSKIHVGKPAGLTKKKLCVCVCVSSSANTTGKCSIIFHPVGNSNDETHVQGRQTAYRDVAGGGSSLRTLTTNGSSVQYRFPFPDQPRYLYTVLLVRTLPNQQLHIGWVCSTVMSTTRPVRPSPLGTYFSPVPAGCLPHRETQHSPQVPSAVRVSGCYQRRAEAETATPPTP